MAAAGATALGFWEDGDQLNLVACFMGARDIAAVACTCRYTRDNLRDSTQLRWLAELRGLDPASTHISSVEHIELAEAMASLETSPRPWPRSRPPWPRPARCAPWRSRARRRGSDGQRDAVDRARGRDAAAPHGAHARDRGALRPRGAPRLCAPVRAAPGPLGAALHGADRGGPGRAARAQRPSDHALLGQLEAADLGARLAGPGPPERPRGGLPESRRAL